MFQATKSEQVVTWFGLKGTVIIGPGFLHKAGFAGILLPHPPVVNWLLRKGLDFECYYILSIAHEIGHLQTAPFALFNAALLLIFAMNKYSGISPIVIALISAQASWEIMAETYTVFQTSTHYHTCYKSVNFTTRIIFWCSSVGFVLLGWVLVLL